MAFLNPIYLWSLLGIAIPIAIHLWSRKKVIKIRVGSTKLLQESEPRRSSSIRPNELWLLFLRTLAILLLALILSQPQLERREQNTSLVYIIDPSLMADQKMDGFLEHIPEESIRIMVDGFPKISDYDLHKTDTEIPDFWQLASEMKILPADSIIAVTKGFLSGVKGKRPVIPNHINWMVLNSEDRSRRIIEVRRKRDSFELLSLMSDFEKLQFEKKKLPENSPEIIGVFGKDSIQINERIIPLNSDDPINILIVALDSLSKEQQYISSAYRAVSKFLERPINIRKISETDSIDAESYDISIWLGIEPISKFSKAKLIFRPDALATKLITDGNSKNEFFLTDSLDAENSVTDHLAEELHALLGLHSSLKKQVRLYDKRVMSVEELQPVHSVVPKTRQRANLVDISPWLWGLVLLVLIAERILAKYRKQ